MGKKLGSILTLIGLFFIAASIYLPEFVGEILPGVAGPGVTALFGIILELIGLYMIWRAP